MRKRMGLPLLAITVAVALSMAGEAEAQSEAGTVVYLVRHAETAADGTRDPALSDQGRARAERLAGMLAGAGLTALHSTSYQRTQGTAEAVSAATGLPVREYDPRDLAGFASRLLAEGGRHLVVGHSNTTPELVALLGGDPGDGISESEYGRVYQLTAGPDGVLMAVFGYNPAEGVASTGSASAGAHGSHADVSVAPADVASVESIVAALYDVISGPAGEARDWDRLRGLFLPTARMIPVQRSAEGEVRYRAVTVEEYIEMSGPMLVDVGFREREIAGRVEQFGDVAHVFSTYEGHREGVEEPFVRGINSIQLIFDGTRWWVSSLAWSPERGDLPIPPRYSP